MSDQPDDSDDPTTVQTKITEKPKASSSKHNQDNDPNKKSTKTMLQEALLELKSRKGVSYYAIKKYIADNYNVDMGRVKHIIKKQLKTAVEEGSILQTKGTGASGSFKLVPMKKDKPKAGQKTESPNVSDTASKKDTKETKKSTGETKKSAENTASKKSTDGKKKPARKVKTDDSNEMVANWKITRTNSTDSSNPKKIVTVDRGDKKNMKKSKAGTSKDMKTPSKKRAMMMKRKSIGSIIKPPKMKPKKAK